VSGFGGKDMNRGGEEIDTILPCSEGRNYSKMGGGRMGGDGGNGGGGDLQIDLERHQKISFLSIYEKLD
jgi:hypothetical protein